MWINALAVSAGLEPGEGGQAAALAHRARTSFAARFRAPGGGVFDVVDSPSGDDATVRPNQLLAYPLPHAPLDAGDLAALTASLLTPLGLRSLAHSAPGYRGPAPRRMRRAGRRLPPGHRLAGVLRSGEVLAGLDAHLGEWGLGSVSETADGDAPHAATGCPFPAWSVAELLRAHRALVE